VGKDWSNYGEYYMERTPEEIQDLRAENRAQNRRLERVEERVTELRVALVGIDDRNGLRGELREHKDYTRAKLDDIDHKLDNIVPTVFKAAGAAIGTLSAFAAVVWTIIQIIGG